MQTIFELKEQAVTDTPLLLFDCALPDGRTEHWSTHAVTVGDVCHSARVLRHNVFELQASSDQGVDGVPRVSLVLANADSHCSQIERTTGWKGARLTAGLVFYDLRNGVALTERSVPPHRYESYESAATIAAAGTDSAAVPVGVPGRRAAAHRSGGWRHEREVLAVLPLRLLSGRGGRHGGTEQRYGFQRVRLHANRLPSAAIRW